ncbi:sodium-independent sulfate anion transporter-like isoform X2 [Babylonia areolata]|uniref:sodium-independent sulfate anion transporter-like isoform X2 n=1 Tax=Babylonia areolata TaxID=304850 RepID=UPI003FD1DEEA
MMDNPALELNEISLHIGAEPPATNGGINAEDTSVSITRGGREKGEKAEAAGVEEGIPVAKEEVPVGARLRRRLKESARQCCSVRTLKRKLPIIQWLPSYRCREFQCDLIAGLTVGLTVIPQGLAYAVIAGLPPQYGLYSAFMGCFVYMFMGTSKDITLGPTAIMSLMVGTFAASPVKDDPTLAIILTLICGLVQLLMGILNLGFLVNYISHPVINSFTSAAAITIGLGQVKNVLGLEDIPREFLHMVYETCAKIPETKVWDLVMGLVSMVLLFILKKLRAIKWKDENQPNVKISIPKMVFRKIIWLSGTAANAIIVISAAGITAGLLSHDIDVITITGNITSGLPPFGAPQFSNPAINLTTSEAFSKIGAGFIIVPLLGLVESIAIGKAFARVNNYKIDATQELLAIGAANILSAFVHSYPITGSFSRTAVNSQSGVKTPAGGLFTGALILLALQVLVPYCYYIPKSALAAVIIMAVIQMVDYKILLVLWRTNKWDLFVHVITFICSLTVGIEYGILIGIGICLLLLLYPMARPKLRVTNEKNVIVIQPDHGLFFPAIEYIESKVLSLALAEEKPKAVILDMLHISGLDFSSLHGIKAMVTEGDSKGIRLVLCQVRPDIAEEIENEKIPDLKMYATEAEAMEELILSAQSECEEEEPFISHL